MAFTWFRDETLGFRVWGLGFGVWGSQLRVSEGWRSPEGSAAPASDDMLPPAEKEKHGGQNHSGQWSKSALTREGGLAGVFAWVIFMSCNAIANNEKNLGEKRICPRAARLPVYTVEYEPFIECQLASRNQLSD